MNGWLPELVSSHGFKTALDVGCGVGYFSRHLANLDLEVVATDGRSENISEARRRHPQVKFVVENIESSAVKKLGTFDLVICFGVLYHLENPFKAIRNLYSLTEGVLVVESVVVPGVSLIASLLEEAECEDQSLNRVALVPSESCLVKMLYCSGFTYVYATRMLPDHEDFQGTRGYRRKRTILVAAKAPIETRMLELVLEPATTDDPWVKPFGFQLERVRRFLYKPWREKIITLRFRFKPLWNRWCPLLPLPVRLPYGGWWLASADFCGDAIFEGWFENAERQFVENFLTDGMLMLDIGAHHGFYTILGSKKVGASGRVIAFEPSPRECGRLIRHIKLNRCHNVVIEPFALGNDRGEATLFVVDGKDTGCNSLRPPAGSEAIREVPVQVQRLDDYLERQAIHRVDFMKIDVEGGELDLLTAAARLLRREPRPVIMCEVEDRRTMPWGYAASGIYDFLAQRNFRWFRITAGGRLHVCTREEYYAANLVAVPEERMAELQSMIGNFSEEVDGGSRTTKTHIVAELPPR